MKQPNDMHVISAINIIDKDELVLNIEESLGVEFIMTTLMIFYNNGID